MTTDWIVLTAFIVIIAVPVLFMLRDGAATSSTDLIVSIRDTSAPSNIGASAEDGVTGYLVDPDAEPEPVIPPEMSGLPAAARRTGTEPLRANAVNSSGSAAGATGRPAEVASTSATRSTHAAHRTTAKGMNAALPVEMIGQSLVLGPGQCFEPVKTVQSPAAAASSETAKLVLASGR